MIQQRTANTSGKGNTKEYIVLHHTASKYGSIDGVLNRFKNTNAQVSAHYVIDTNGTVYNFNTDDDILWHAGESTREGKRYLNSYSIGIELIGPLPGFTKEQKKSLRDLIDHLQKKHTIGSKNIIRHKDISPGRKVDVDDKLRSLEYGSREEYQKTFSSNQNQMSEKEMLIISLMNLNSILYNKVDDEELKKLMSKTNTRFRELGFDNK